jgi:hypothetical protein
MYGTYSVPYLVAIFKILTLHCTVRNALFWVFVAASGSAAPCLVLLAHCQQVSTVPYYGTATDVHTVGLFFNDTLII